MSRVIFFDAGPLGIITNPKTPTPNLTVAAIEWAIELGKSGHRLIIPAIADFEVRCELVRVGKKDGIALLDAWNSAQPDRYLPLADSALRLASDLWAHARNSGVLPADPKELNCDILIAAQALDYQAIHGLAISDILIATMNLGHLSLFVPADI